MSNYQPIRTTIRRTEADDIIPEWRYSKPVWVAIDYLVSDPTRIVGIRLYRRQSDALRHSRDTYLAAEKVLGHEAMTDALNESGVS